MQCTFEQGLARVKDLQVREECKLEQGRLSVKRIELDGRSAVPSKRFWKSLFMRFGISDNIFRYFTPEEVFERISRVAPDDCFRWCIERRDKGPDTLLAVSSPNRPLISYAEVSDLVGRYGGRDVEYASGIVRSTHTPRGGDRTFEVRGDQLQHRFVLETPVDGFGHPKVYLSFLRVVCSNGMIGYTRAFRSDISLGKEIRHCIARALESYDNGDGYAALRQRFESAQTSWASIRECQQLYRALVGASNRKELAKTNVLTDLSRMTGNLNAIYGLANLEALSVKRQRVLPAKCRVYDLLNFASEIATHHATPDGNRTMQAYIGTMISDEYDMEGTAETVTDFRDFFVGDAGNGPRPSVN